MRCVNDLRRNSRAIRQLKCQRTENPNPARRYKPDDPYVRLIPRAPMPAGFTQSIGFNNNSGSEWFGPIFPPAHCVRNRGIGRVDTGTQGPRKVPFWDACRDTPNPMLRLGYRAGRAILHRSSGIKDPVCPWGPRLLGLRAIFQLEGRKFLTDGPLNRRPRRHIPLGRTFLRPAVASLRRSFPGLRPD